MEDNFDSFVSSYNSSENPIEYWYPSGIEFSSIVYIIEKEYYGLYLDFSENNGYTVVDYEFNMYVFEPIGDLPLRDKTEYYYSLVDGFVEIDSNNLYSKLFLDDEIELEVVAFQTAYTWQEEAGDGRITSSKINAYVTSRYGDAYDYELENETLADDITAYSQMDLSYYVKCKVVTVSPMEQKNFSEGNCSLTAIYNTMANWSANSKIKNIDCSVTMDVYENIKSDILYSAYSPSTHRYFNYDDEDYYNYVYYYYVSNSDARAIPVLYDNVRTYALYYHGYSENSGITNDGIVDTIETVSLNSYGVSIDVNSTSEISNAIASIDAGKAVIASMWDSTTYGDHAVSVVGYQMYSYEVTSFFFFTKTYYVYFLQLYDGWGTTTYYFDPNCSDVTILYDILNV